MEINRNHEYVPKTFMGSLAKSLGFDVENPRVSLMAQLGETYQQAYLCETELERRKNLERQEMIKAALRALDE